MRIFLIGFMGAGKSYWLKKLEPFTEYPCLDLDEYIEQKEGKAISQLFNEIGEKHFRKIESHRLQELISKYEHFILACGGGTPCYNDNLKLMKGAGRVIYLKLPSILENPFLKLNDPARPLTMGHVNHASLISLFEQRVHFYEQSDVIIDVMTLNQSNFVQKLIPNE